MSWEFRQPRVERFEPEEFLPGSGDDDEMVDVSCFNPSYYVVTFEARRIYRLFGRIVWRGSWGPMQLVCR